MPYNMEPHAIHLKAGDEITLQISAQPLFSSWDNLPEKTQQELVQQAELVRSPSSHFAARSNQGAHRAR